MVDIFLVLKAETIECLVVVASDGVGGKERKGCCDGCVV